MAVQGTWHGQCVRKYSLHIIIDVLRYGRPEHVDGINNKSSPFTRITPTSNRLVTEVLACNVGPEIPLSLIPVMTETLEQWKWNNDLPLHLYELDQQRHDDDNGVPNNGEGASHVIRSLLLCIQM